MEIKMLKAKNGDCFIISHIDRKGNRHNIVIDGGPARAFQVNETVLKAANAEGIDLMILTHTDDDHIGGLLKFFEKMEEIIWNRYGKKCFRRQKQYRTGGKYLIM